MAARPLAAIGQEVQDPQRGFKRDLSKGPIDLDEQEIKAPELHLQLPDLSLPQSRESIGAHLAHVYCASLTLNGNSVLPAAEVASITKPLVGREITVEELALARSALTKLYVARGFVNSGVVLPDQAVRNGVITLQAIEGQLTQIRVEGAAPRMNLAKLLRRLKQKQSRPLNVLELRDELALIGRNPLVKRASGELLATGKLGEAELVLTLTPASVWSAFVTADNHRAPSVGSAEARVDIANRSLLGFGDQASVHYALTKGLDDWGLRYLAPVATSDWAVGVQVSHDTASVVQPPFARLDISSNDRSAEIEVRRLLHFDLGYRFEMSAVLTRIDSNTFLFGIPFSFAPGVNNGVSTIAEAQLVGDWQWWWPTTTLAMHASVGDGLDALGATRNETGPDGRYARLSTQLFYSRLLDSSGDRLLARFGAQLASTQLLPLVKFELGGADSVRGFRTNEIVRDNGFSASAELRHPLFDASSSLHRLELALFTDYGRGWNNSGVGPPPQTLSSAGMGFVWNARENLYAELYAAKGFQSLGHVGNNLQDDGIHVLISYRAF